MEDNLSKLISNHPDAYSYTGRGKRCLGITGSSVAEVLAVVMDLFGEEYGEELVCDVFEELNYITCNFRHDPFGHDVVVYWPHLTYTDPDENEDNED